MKRPIIQSKVIQDNYLKLFIPYSENVEDYVFEFNKSLKPENDIRGLGSDITFNDSNGFKNRDSIRNEYIKTINILYSVSVDSTIYKTEFILSKSLKDKMGFETYIGIDSLSKGKHLLKLNRNYLKDKDTLQRNIAEIPFWYYRD